MAKSKKNENILQARLTLRGKRKLRSLARRSKMTMTQLVESMIDTAYAAARGARE